MKNYTITVNGNVYDVTVEETGSTPSAAPVRKAAPAAKAAPAPAAIAAIPIPTCFFAIVMTTFPEMSSDSDRISLFLPIYYDFYS